MYQSWKMYVIFSFIIFYLYSIYKVSVIYNYIFRVEVYVKYIILVVLQDEGLNSKS